MAYEPKTIKVELDGGNGNGPTDTGPFAVLYQEFRHGTQRAVNTITRPFLDYGGPSPKLSIDQEEGKPKIEGANEVQIDLTKIDFDALNDAIIVGQVKEWSFGEVNMETLDDIPESARTRLVMEFNGRYGRPLPDGGGENLAKGCSGP